MADVDLTPILLALGRLEGKVDTEIASSKSQRATLFTKIDTIVDVNSQAAAAMATVVQRLEDHHTADERRFIALERVDDALGASIGAVSSRVGGMEMTAAQKAGNVAKLGIFMTFIASIVTAIAGQWK